MSVLYKQMSYKWLAILNVCFNQKELLHWEKKIGLYRLCTFYIYMCTFHETNIQSVSIQWLSNLNQHWVNNSLSSTHIL